MKKKKHKETESNTYLPKYSFLMTYALIRPVCKIVDGVNTRACKLRKNGREEENGLYRNTKQGAKEKQIHEVSKKLKSSFMVKVGEVKALNGVEDNN